MQAILNGQVIAEAAREDLIYIEGKWYFPPGSVNKEFLTKSNTPYTCYWKGDCQYFDVGNKENISKDNAWTYPDLLPGATERVKKDFSNYVAFWRDVKVEE